MLVAAAVGACVDGPVTTQSSGGTWLPPSGPERDAAIERQFRGFDMAMVETGYRFAELYWAGGDQNWRYAAYQAEKIQTAIANGLERRPARAASAQPFLNEALPSVVRAVEAGDSAAFDVSFRVLIGACNSCHASEQMEFVVVTGPTQRTVPLGG
jgi:hypothetical protein